MREMRRSGRRDAGFTLIEMAIVLVIAGIIMSIGVSGWMLLAEGRKNSATLATMRKVRDCMVNYVAQTGLYPAYSSDLASNANAAVDICLRDKNDAWGEQIMFLEGVRDGGGSLAGLCLLSTDLVADGDPCSPNHASAPPIKPDATSTLTDKDGNSISDLAFVLISFGRLRNADHTSYGNRLDPAQAGVFANQMSSGTSPNFSASLLTGEDDDLYLAVTYPELVSEVAKGRF
jgi:prepilin-type N-terminal cleavage/methylation domain-containing protein